MYAWRKLLHLKKSETKSDLHITNSTQLLFGIPYLPLLNFLGFHFVAPTLYPVKHDLIPC